MTVSSGATATRLGERPERVPSLILNPLACDRARGGWGRRRRCRREGDIVRLVLADEDVAGAGVARAFVAGPAAATAGSGALLAAPREGSEIEVVDRVRGGVDPRADRGELCSLAQGAHKGDSNWRAAAHTRGQQCPPKSVAPLMSRIMTTRRGPHR